MECEEFLSTNQIVFAYGGIKVLSGEVTVVRIVSLPSQKGLQREQILSF